jgi:hypothetical protein
VTRPAAIRARIEQALRELPLSEADIAKATPALLDGIAFLQQKTDGLGPKPNSAVFDFRGKVTALVEHFAPDGLTAKVVFEKRYLFTAALTYTCVRRIGGFSRRPAQLLQPLPAPLPGLCVQLDDRAVCV